MTDEEKKNCCIGKHDVCRALVSVVTSFIGALLALAVFAAIHKPPRVERQLPPPPPAQENIHRGGHNMMPQANHFKDERRGEFKEHKGPGDEMIPPAPQDHMQPQKQATQPQTPVKK